MVYPRNLYLQYCASLAALACFVICSPCAYGQDPVFSQYTATPVYSNPGLAGLYEGEVRLIANYRDQWSSSLDGKPLRSYAASAEMRYALSGRDFLAVAANVLHDKGGQAQFSTNQAGLGLSLQKYLSGGRGRDATYLGVGARVGYGQNRIDPNALWFSSQFDTTSVSVSMEPSGGMPAGFVGQTRGYLDAVAGLNLTVVRRRYSLYGGVAGHHLNRPNVSFLFNTEVLLPMRYTVLLGGEYLFEDGLRLLPSATVELQGANRRATFGAAMYYKPEGRGDAGMRMGLYARTASQAEGPDILESIIVAAQVELRTLTIGVSYDVNVARLARATDGRGAYELSVVYVRQGKSRHRVVCPKM